MFKKYLRFSLILSPLYMFLGLGFIIGFMLTAEKDARLSSFNGHIT
ncbi:MAG: hypothetical protein ACQEXB_23920 [Bacillota bacterium]